jgi:hypothetical protein
VTDERSSHASPEAIKAVHGWLAVFWASHIPPAFVAYFVMERSAFIALSLLYTVVASQWANVATHFTGWVAGRIEVHQEENEHDVHG